MSAAMSTGLAHSSALFTDLYELTMLQAYHAENMNGTAVFELHFRNMPERRNYIVAAGLDDVLEYLQNLYFTADEIAWLRDQQRFSERFLRTLRDFRFSGDVYAVPEGSVVFAYEPLLQIVAPLPEAQLVETYVLNQIHLQSVLASKSARIVCAAAGRVVVDFGSRRSHGTDAALKAARCSYLAGAAGTSNVAAGRLYDIPVFGTMAHSYIQAHASEMAAFRSFAGEFPRTTLLVDTYDTLSGVRRVIELAKQLGDDFQIQSIRLDSGDLADLAGQARTLLDNAGLRQVKIFASSGLDEYKLAALITAAAPIDGFGVGTELAVSGDMPSLDLSYKLVEYAGKPCMKLSSNKLILPGRKQVYRNMRNARMSGDVIAAIDEPAQGTALLRPVMRNGRRLAQGRAGLQQARQHARSQLAALPDEMKALQPAPQPYPVTISPHLLAATKRLRTELEHTEVS